jgi:hypothetical protein
MKNLTKVLAAIMLMISVAGCAGMSSTEQRVLSGGAIGAGAGAAVGAISGGSAATGAVVGGAAGVVGGLIVDEAEKRHHHGRYGR